MASAGAFEARCKSQESALAATGGADKHAEHTRLEFEGNVANGFEITVALADGLERDGAHRMSAPDALRSHQTS